MDRRSPSCSRCGGKPPRMNEMVCMVASLGGYIKRRTSDPGPQTLWIGLQKLHCLSLAWETFGPKP